MRKKEGEEDMEMQQKKVLECLSCPSSNKVQCVGFKEGNENLSKKIYSNFYLYKGMEIENRNRKWLKFERKNVL